MITLHTCTLFGTIEMIQWNVFFQSHAKISLKVYFKNEKMALKKLTIPYHSLGGRGLTAVCR